MMRILPVLAVLLSLAGRGLADVLVLTDGTKVEGTLVEVTEKQARIRVGRSVKTFDRGEVAEIFRGGKKNPDALFTQRWMRMVVSHKRRVVPAPFTLVARRFFYVDGEARNVVGEHHYFSA